MSIAHSAIHTIYLRVAAQDIAQIKFVFESYEGVGIVRTVEVRTAIIVVLVVEDFLPIAREILGDLQQQIDFTEIPRPQLEPDDWLMKEIR